MKLRFCYATLVIGCAMMTVGVGFAQPQVAEQTVLKRWTFDRLDDREGWTLEEEARAVVMGGSLWVSLAPPLEMRKNFSKSVYQVFGVQVEGLRTGRGFSAIDLSSTRGLHLSAGAHQGLRLTLRLLNLSPITSIDVVGRDASGKEQKPRKCALAPDTKVWQDLTCYFNEASVNVDQIILRIAPPTRGDLWVDSIEVNAGARPALPARPDVASAHVVPRLSVEGLSQAGFADAFAIMDETLYLETPINGFPYPIMRPGGIYQDWWFFDGVIQAKAARWTHQAFAENVMRGFATIQAGNPDGRIDMAGYAQVRGQPGDLSMEPGVFFEAAHEIALGSADEVLRLQILAMMERYLDWWLSPVKRDSATGLISAIHEETFGEDGSLAEIMSDEAVAPQSVAPIDTNVNVAVGAALTADLARRLGHTSKAERYLAAQRSLAAAINTYLWDEKDGVYYNYDLKRHELRKQLRASMFETMRLAIAPPDRRARLITRLTDPKQFSWGTRPLNMRSKQDPTFVEHPGPRFDHAVFKGSLWPAQNLHVIAALEESGHHELAAELNWQTIKLLHNHYAEIIQPSTGKGIGAARFGTTAGHYVSAVIGHLFGIDVDATSHCITIEPHVPRALHGKTIALERLIMPNAPQSRLSVRIHQSSPTTATIDLGIDGVIPNGTFKVKLPGSSKQTERPLAWSLTLTIS